MVGKDLNKFWEKAWYKQSQVGKAFKKFPMGWNGQYLGYCVDKWIWIGKN